jgi:sugar phosphate isomerase/epimerase
VNNQGRLSRRGAVAAIAGAAASAFAQQSAAPRVTPEVATAHAKRPLLCVYSGCLAKIPYPQLIEIVRAMGYDGVDLTVMKGGHVDPSRYMVDLDRAFQTIQDGGLDLPMVTTDFTSPSQPYAYAILYVSAQLGARVCRLGAWPPPVASLDANIRAMMMHNDLAQFAATGQRCNILPMLANHAGSYPGRSIPEAETLLTGVDRAAFGYCFDPAQAVIEARSADGWQAALPAALPRLGAVAISDVAIENAGPRFCALGEGSIDWKKFFAMLATARFHGPVSMHMDYDARNAVNAMTKDLAFVRARVEEAWPAS